MSALLESLAQGFEGDAATRATLDAVLREGLPKPRSELWKYTSLRALERRTFVPVPAQRAPIEAGLLAGIDGPRIVFVNGVFDARVSRLEALPEGVTLQAGIVEAAAPVAHADFAFAGMTVSLTDAKRLHAAASGAIRSRTQAYPCCSSCNARSGPPVSTMRPSASTCTTSGRM